MGEHKEHTPLEKFEKGETLWDVISSILRHTWVTFLHRHNVRTSSKLFTVNKVADTKSELFPPPHENPFNGSFWYFLSIWLPNVIALFYFYKTTWLCFLAKNPAPSYFFRKTLTNLSTWYWSRIWCWWWRFWHIRLWWRLIWMICCHWMLLRHAPLSLDLSHF